MPLLVPVQGGPRALTVPELAAAPAALVDVGSFYSKDVGGVTEGFYREDSAAGGTETQITNAGALNVSTASISPLTTLGDLWVYTTVDTRLGVGADGTLLQADSGEASGIGWDTTLTGAYTFSAAQIFSSTVALNDDVTLASGKHLILSDSVSDIGATGAALRTLYVDTVTSIQANDLAISVAAAAADTAGNDLLLNAGDAGAHSVGNPSGGDLILLPGSLGVGGTGSDGVAIIRSGLAAAVAGTDEIQIWHDGTDGVIDSKSGVLKVKTGSQATALQMAESGAGPRVLDLWVDGNQAYIIGNNHITLRSGTSKDLIFQVGGTGTTYLELKKSSNFSRFPTVHTRFTYDIRLGNSIGDPGAQADFLCLYSTDLSAGNTMLGIRSEGGGMVGTGTPTQDRTIAMEVDGVTLYVLAATAAS